jgi:alkylation response protein AidB-like acyl-CoA dehydrogenase
MTTTNEWGRGPTSRYDDLAKVFRPVFARIAEGTLAREIERKLPFEEIGWLKEVRFGALRVPEAEGGYGATLPELFELLSELAHADSNFTQILRAHFGAVEDVLASRDSARRGTWFKRLGVGDIFGGGFTERGGAKAGTFATTIRRRNGGWIVNGEKYYSTGSLFADWIELVGTGPDDKVVVAIVPTSAAGLTQRDDWNGFGQKLTGSGTSIYQEIELPFENVLTGDDRFKYQAAFYQTVHLATLTGIGRAAADEVADLVARRTRTFTHATARIPRQDPQVLQVVGQAHASAYAAGAITQRVAAALQFAHETASEGSEDAVAAANLSAELEAAEGQIVVSKLVLDSTAGIFNALAASATSTAVSLDRHWRNARTISSHNPAIYKERVVGDYAVNQTAPPYLWLPGEA